jgi:hypothetical protein
MASGLIGRIGSRLVSLPANLVAIGPGLVEKATATNGKKVVARWADRVARNAATASGRAFWELGSRKKPFHEPY